MESEQAAEKRMAELRQAVASDPTNTDKLYELGRALESSGRLEEALACFESIVLSEPDDHESIHAIGALHLHLGRNADAIASLKKATEIWQDAPEYFVDLGDACYRSQDLPGAREAYEAAQSLALQDEEIWARISQGLAQCQNEPPGERS